MSKITFLIGRQNPPSCFSRWSQDKCLSHEAGLLLEDVVYECTKVFDIKATFLTVLSRK